MEEYPAVPLFFIKARTALADNVMGFKTLPVKWWNLEEVWLEPQTKLACLTVASRLGRLDSPTVDGGSLPQQR
jgi:hypothetical protein